MGVTILQSFCPNLKQLHDISYVYNTRSLPHFFIILFLDIVIHSNYVIYIPIPFQIDKLLVLYSILRCLKILSSF